MSILSDFVNAVTGEAKPEPVSTKSAASLSERLTAQETGEHGKGHVSAGRDAERREAERREASHQPEVVVPQVPNQAGGKLGR